jgi:PTH1 family peptidyl-tRNA hydrolase
MRFFSRKQPEVPPRYLVVGLGNPGAEYQNTRHNVGFRVIDRLAERHRMDVKKFERRALVGYGAIEETAVALAKPQTYMNLSGESVAPLLRQLQLTPEDLIVVYDEMDLPVGRIRLRKQGSAGGHNGVKSLIQHLQTDAFARIRIGVGRPKGDPSIDHVLGKFGRNEIEPIRDAIDRTADAVEAILAEGLDAAMNRFNRKEDGAASPDGED